MLRDADFYLDTLIDTKAVEAEDGDLVIEGLASDIGLDREGEAFEPGVFQKAIETYLSSNAPLLYHHKPDMQLGTITELEPRDNGLYFKAVIPQPPAGNWAEGIYNMVKRGMMKGVSVGGQFHRKSGRIHAADFHEISITPLPVNPRTLLTVAQKAFGAESFEPSPDSDLDEADEKAVMEWFEDRFARVEAVFADARKALTEPPDQD